jgi:group I intron endonuclease
MLINKALLNNGYSVFRLEILEYCDKELLIDREQYYLDLLKPEYNILEFAYSSIGFKHSAATLKKLKDRILTPEQKFKLKKHLNELNSKQFTDEFKSKLSKGTANLNRLSKGKKVNFTNIETDTKLEFSS